MRETYFDLALIRYRTMSDSEWTYELCTYEEFEEYQRLEGYWHSINLEVVQPLAEVNFSSALTDIIKRCYA